MDDFIKEVTEELKKDYEGRLIESLTTGKFHEVIKSLRFDLQNLEYKLKIESTLNNLSKEEKDNIRINIKQINDNIINLQQLINE